MNFMVFNPFLICGKDGFHFHNVLKTFLLLYNSEIACFPCHITIRASTIITGR
jgi:hypothetical protein